MLRLAVLGLAAYRGLRRAKRCGAVPLWTWIAQNVLGSNSCSKKQAKTVMVTDRVAVYGIYEADTDELGWIVLYDVFSVGG